MPPQPWPVLRVAPPYEDSMRIPAFRPRRLVNDRPSEPGALERMADIGRPEREIDVRPSELPVPSEVPVESPMPVPREPLPDPDPVPA